MWEVFRVVHDIAPSTVTESVKDEELNLEEEKNMKARKSGKENNN